MISLKQIVYALAVQKTLHFKRASEICNVSQSALSTAITEFEKHLGIQVFERTNKQVLVTTAGEAVLRKAQRIKTEMDELTQMAAADKEPFTKPLSIGLIPTIGPYLLPKVLPALREQYPKIQLKVKEDQSHVLTEMVRAGDLDIVIMALPYPLEGLMTFEFWEEDFYVVTHKEQCNTAQTEITSHELELDQLMLLKDGHCLKEHALEACSMKANRQDQGFDSASLYTLIQMVAGKLGTTLVPQMALDQLVTPQSELHAYHLNEPGPHRRLALVIRPNYIRTHEVMLLKALFTEQLHLAAMKRA